MSQFNRLDGKSLAKKAFGVSSGTFITLWVSKAVGWIEYLVDAKKSYAWLFETTLNWLLFLTIVFGFVITFVWMFSLLRKLWEPSKI